jgi:methyl-accepting chemotaxis protein
VAEVVRAMAVGSPEVEKSAELGRWAGEALTSILGGVQETNAQAEAISGAVGAMTASIAGQTTQAAVAMRENAGHRQNSVESIAAVSEQSAAGAEEVSASTQEQTASVEQMSAGAQELAALASGLKKTVDRFTPDATTITSAKAKTEKVRPIRAVA